MQNNETVHLLTQVGFTETQAKIYHTLLNIGQTDAKTLSKQTNTSIQVTYRTLDELLAKGIIEKNLSTPNKYQAIAIEEATELILNVKAEEYASALDKTRQILSHFNKEKAVDPKNPDYSIKIVEGKETIINKCRNAHTNTVFSVAVCSTFQRWIQMGRAIHETIQNNLTRGIEYSIVVEKPNGEIIIPEEIKTLLKHRNYNVKIHNNPLKVNAVIFDEALTGFSLYTQKSIGETPMIWTNHPSIITGFQEYFKKIWNSTKTFKKQKKNNEIVLYS